VRDDPSRSIREMTDRCTGPRCNAQPWAVRVRVRVKVRVRVMVMWCGTGIGNTVWTRLCKGM
jgi:hypothetical protein